MSPGTARFDVSFPDFPDAVTHGATLEEALRAAVKCLSDAEAGLMAVDSALPPPENISHRHTDWVHLPALLSAKAALHTAIRQSGLSQVAVAARLDCDEKAVRRMLDPDQNTKIDRLENALRMLGYRLVAGGWHRKDKGMMLG